MEDAIKRRTAPPRGARNTVSYNESYQPYMESLFRSPKRTKPTAPPPPREQIVEGDDDRKSKVDIGDCVLVANNEEEYVALVCAVHPSSFPQNTTFTALWFYRPEDIAKDILEKIDGGVMENEIFQSTERDTNSIDHISGKCQVISELDYRDRLNVAQLGQNYDDDDQIFVCRYKYDPKKHTFEPIMESWDIRLGLGKPEPNVGEDYQAANLPLCTRPKASRPFLGKPLWSPALDAKEPYALKVFLKSINHLRYNVGAIVKYYHKYASASGGSQCRAMVSRFKDRETIVICVAAGGALLETLLSNVSSAYTEDLAMQEYHACQQNYQLAMENCIRSFKEIQLKEKKMFRRELQIYQSKS